MRYLVILTFTVILSATATAALALELGFLVTPDSKDVSVSAEMAANENIRFTIHRDPTKTNLTGRTATLRVYDAAGPLVICNVTPTSTKQDITYEFFIASKHVAKSSFVLTEHVTVKDGQGPPVDGISHSIRLRDFTKHLRRAGSRLP